MSTRWCYSPIIGNMIRALLNRLYALPFLTRVVIQDARLVRQGRSFVMNEAAAYTDGVRDRLRGRPAENRNLRDPIRYTFADGGDIFLRPGTGDAYTVWEVFVSGHYDPPPEPARTLDGCARPLRIVDLGMNIGLSTRFMLARFGDCRVDGYEPEPGNLAILERNINPNDPRVTIHSAAASVDATPLRFASADGPCSGEVFDDGPEKRAVIEVPAEDALPVLIEADFIKMDIEGGEWALLNDPRFAQTHARVIALEYHEMGCPEDDPYAYAALVLHKMGFIIGYHEPTSGRSGVMWAWRA